VTEGRIKGEKGEKGIFNLKRASSKQGHKKKAEVRENSKHKGRREGERGRRKKGEGGWRLAGLPAFDAGLRGFKRLHKKSVRF